MFCKHFSKNMSMVSATHCCSNCAEADLPLCLPCVSLPIFFFLSSSFHYFSFSFPFLFVFPFHLEAAQIKLKLTCCDASLSPVSLSLCLCASSGFHRNHTLVIFGSCGHRRIDWPMMLDWKNWLIYCRAANSLCTFFPSGVQQIVCGTITNRNWNRNRNRNSCCRRDSLWICPEFIIYFSLFFVGTMQVTTKVY